MKLKIEKKKNKNNTVSLNMTGELSIYTVAKMRDILLKELDSFSGLVLNLAAIDDADTAGFQLLVFIKREALNAGKSLVIENASARVKSIFSLYNESI